MRKITLIIVTSHSFFSLSRDQYCKSFGAHSYSGNIVVKNWGEAVYYSVGNFTSIADNLTIFLGGNHRHDWVSTYPFPSYLHVFPEAANIKEHHKAKGNVIIGNDVWIGSHVTILSGVNIGDGAVIGAYSVVAKDVPPYAVFVGNPGRVVKYRFSEEVIQQFLQLQWWNWSLAKIRQNMNLMCSTNIQEFLTMNRET